MFDFKVVNGLKIPKEFRNIDEYHFIITVFADLLWDKEGKFPSWILDQAHRFHSNVDIKYDLNNWIKCPLGRISNEEVLERVIWIIENSQNEWCYYYACDALCFETEKDAMFYKLRWV